MHPEVADDSHNSWVEKIVLEAKMGDVVDFKYIFNRANDYCYLHHVAENKEQQTTIQVHFYQQWWDL